MSGDDHSISGVRRFEVFTGAGKRRDWAPEVKAAIVAESYSGLTTTCAVARRHGLAPSQLFVWRRQLRDQLASKGLCLPTAAAEVAAFVPAVVEEPCSSPSVLPRRRRRRSQPGAIELEIDGALVKIGRGADAQVIAAVIDALRATR